MNDQPLTPVTRRRTFILGALGAAALAFIGSNWLPRRSGIGPSAGDRSAGDGSGHIKTALLAFLGALFGREFSEQDIADLSDRLDELLAASAMYARNAQVLTQLIDELAQKQGAVAFSSSSADQKELIVSQVMSIDYRSITARILGRLSAKRRDYNDMRNLIVPALTWLYRHSAAAWRARGYTRWPGVAGDWHEVLVPGAPYP